VDRIQRAGAIITGKTNVPVMAADLQSYNQIYGTSNNPWDLTRTPGGSTGGGAAALAAGLGHLTLGSDIGGSIRIPSHFCGIYGHKPTLELVSTTGTVPNSRSFVWRGAGIRHRYAFASSIAVLQQSAPRCLRLRQSDRLLWIWLSRFWPGWQRWPRILKRDTVLCWHRRAFRAIGPQIAAAEDQALLLRFAIGLNKWARRTCFASHSR
jgi:hypothetical protein